MSTFTTSTPAPQMSRTPFIVGIAAVGVVAVSVVAGPRIASYVGSSATTGTTTGTSVTNQHDAVEHQADTARARVDAHTSSAIQRQVDHAAKSRAAQAAAVGTVVTAVVSSTAAQQIGGMHATYPYKPAAFVAAGISAAQRGQVGGMQPTFPYTGSRPAQVSEHTRWNDSFVPPYDDPAWKPFIQRHYAGTQPTHEFH